MSLDEYIQTWVVRDLPGSMRSESFYVNRHIRITFQGSFRVQRAYHKLLHEPLASF